MTDQNTLILRALKKGKTITPLDALVWWNCFRLAARIRDLRQEGYPIQTVTEERNGKRWARYRMRRAA